MDEFDEFDSEFDPPYEIEEFKFPIKPDKRLVRRKRTAHKKNKELRMAKENTKYPGPYYSEEKGRVLFAKRSSATKFFKKIAAKKARNTNVGICGRANYRKAYDLWWQLT